MSDADNIVHIPLTDIYADSEFNCRGQIAPIDVYTLANNIAREGLLNPIIVEPYDKEPGKKYRIIAGYRRFAAFGVNKAETIPCIVREHLSDTQARIINLGENLNREDLNILQEAKAITPFVNIGWKQDKIAKELNVTRPWVQARIYLLNLPPDIQQEAAAGILTQANIFDLQTLPRDKQYEEVRRIKEKKAKGAKAVSVKKDTFKAKNSKKARKKDEIFDKIDEIFDMLGHSNFGTRCLAWAAGEISDNDLEKEILKEKQQPPLAM